MAMEYASLEPGQTISDTEFEMDASSVSAYVDAVGDESGIFDPDDPRSPVPPMAIAARSLRSVLDELAIQPGTLHAGQEIEFIDAVEVGEKFKLPRDRWPELRSRRVAVPNHRSVGERRERTRRDVWQEHPDGACCGFLKWRQLFARATICQWSNG